jgi:hypothetical protein
VSLGIAGIVTVGSVLLLHRTPEAGMLRRVAPRGVATS